MLNNDSLFKKKVSDFNNLDLILQIHRSIPQVRFSDEPPDAYLYEGRDVWTMIDKAEVDLVCLSIQEEGGTKTVNTESVSIEHATLGLTQTNSIPESFIHFLQGGYIGPT